MRVLFAVAALILCSLILAEGQQPPASPEDRKPQSEAGVLPSEGESVLRLALPHFKPRFNPQLSYTAAEAQLYINLFESLTVSHPRTLRPEPGLAASWQISDDGLTYKFIIRKEAAFSDGTKIVAQDFINSWLYLMKPERQAAFASLLDPVLGANEYLAGRDDRIAGLTAEGPDTLVIRLSQPSPHILSILSHHSLAPIHPSMLSLARWDGLTSEQIYTSGAYKIADFSENVVTMVANPYYYDRKNVGITHVEVQLTNNEEEILNDFNNGYLDWVNSSVPLEKISQVDSIQYSPLFTTTFIYFRSDQPAWSDQRVRKALLLLLPLNKLRQGFRADERLVPPMPGYPLAKGISESDRLQALELLEEAGFPHGKGLPKMIIRIGSEFQIHEDSLLGIIENTWKDALDLEVEFMPVSAENLFDNRNQNDDFGLGVLSWIGDYPDPMAFLQLWQAESSLNFFAYRDAKFDLMLKNANQAPAEQRLAELAKAEEYLLQSGALLPIRHGPATNIINTKKIAGWYNNVLDLHPLRYLEKRNVLPLNSI